MHLTATRIVTSAPLELHSTLVTIAHHSIKLKRMEAIFQKSVKRAMESEKPIDTVPWELDSPYPQHIYTYDTAATSWTSGSSASAQSSGTAITHMALYSWNIDFMLPFEKDRMRIGLSHLQPHIASLPPSTAAVIFLQECLTEDLVTIGDTQWVRDGFRVTDTDSEAWGSTYYGTTTLVDKRLDVKEVFRVHYSESNMQRDALFVDINIPISKEERKIIRFCNTHLESLVTPLRAPQVALAAKFMHAPEVSGALAAGDFNSIAKYDRTLHSENGLQDVYLELGGKEDSDEGYTWGQQAATVLREQFGCSRMDKVYLSGKLTAEKFERFGVDVELENEEQRKEVKDLGFEKAWITDHLGVMTVVSLDGLR
ncbi:endonuclease/exonuclease/phosphatase family protein [Xylariaceae sp. FL1272]|nr:endonuclease/exonuclease/phosphatase family protein [Xylariaceae sp. FL1272]